MWNSLHPALEFLMSIKNVYAYTYPKEKDQLVKLCIEPKGVILLILRSLLPLQIVNS